MKSTLLILGSILLSVALYAGDNPVLDLFPNEVTFLLSFDQADCIADMGGGQNEPRHVRGKVSFAEGVFGGKSLLTGHPTYKAAENLDLTASGTLILWVAPVNWPATKPADGKEPGFRSFMAAGGDYQFLVGKMSGQPWQWGGHLNTYVQYTDGKTRHVSCIRYGNASIAGTQKEGICGPWRNGEWRMLVSTWSGGTITNSANGQKSVSSRLKKLMIQPTDWFQVGTTEETSPYQFRTDEVVILNRALSDQEIARLYAESVKLIRRLP